MDRHSDKQGIKLEPSICLLVVVTMFLVGAIAGAVTASHTTGDAQQYFSFTSDDAVTVSMVISRFLNLYKYHFAAFFFSFSFLGFFLIPVLSAFRGFYLALSVSVVWRAFSGIGAALAVFGVSVVFSIPTFLCISVSSMGTAGALFNISVRKQKIPASSFMSRSFFKTFFITTAILLIGAILDCYVTPKLISYFI